MPHAWPRRERDLFLQMSMFPDTCRNIEIARPFCGHFGYILNQIWLKFDYISAPFAYHLASFEASRKCVPVSKPKALNQCEAVLIVVITLVSY